MNEAEDRMEWASNKEKEQIKEKNERRKDAIDGLRTEIKDEHDDQIH